MTKACFSAKAIHSPICSPDTWLRHFDTFCASCDSSDSSDSSDRHLDRCDRCDRCDQCDQCDPTGLGQNAYVEHSATVTTLEIKRCDSLVRHSNWDPPIALTVPLLLDSLTHRLLKSHFKISFNSSMFLFQTQLHMGSVDRDSGEVGHTSISTSACTHTDTEAHMHRC